MITDKDRSLLNHLGRMLEKDIPPSVSELTVAMGYAPSSQSAVRRRLQRMRGMYVEWEDRKSRSIRLTKEGWLKVDAVMARKAEASDRAASADGLDRELLERIASALMALKTSPVPGNELDYGPRGCPHILRHVMSELYLRVLRSGETPMRGDIPAFLQMCTRPLGEWPLPLRQGISNEEVLWDRGPTEDCESWAVDGPFYEQELEQRALRDARDLCRLTRMYETYVQFRRIPIENPVMHIDDYEDQKWKLFVNSQHGSDLMDLMDRIYERVPSEILVDGRILLCNHCGWTRNSDAPLHCGAPVCAQVVGERTKGVKSRQGPASRHYRVKSAIKRFTVIPGLSELDLKRALERIHANLAITLWPAADVCDLLVRSPGGYVWLVDVKDWQSPFALAAKTTGFSDTNIAAIPHDSIWLVVPDHRKEMRARYMADLKSNWQPPARGRCGYATDFIKEVRRKVQEEQAHA